MGARRRGRTARVVGVAWVAVLAGACVAPRVVEPSDVPASSAIPTPSPPVIVAVSRSHPQPGAVRALDECSLTDSTGRFGDNGPLGLDLVVRMGLVSRARDIPLYVPFGPNVPEFQNDTPAWVIETKGKVTLVLDPYIEIDPTCVVVGNAPFIWFGTGGSIHPDNSIETPTPPEVPPIYALPSLAP